MGRFEEGFQEVERAGTSLLKMVSSTVSTAKQLLKASRAGDLNDTRRTAEKLRIAMANLDGEASAAVSAWPFDASAEEAYLAQGYAGELMAAAAKAGVTIRQLGKDRGQA